MSARWAPALLAVVGLLHLAALVALGRPVRTPAVTAGDAAFLVTGAAAYLMAAAALARRRPWGRWLGLAVSGVESIPGVVLAYVQLVFAADPARRLTLEQIGFAMLLLMPLGVFVVVWLHRSGKQQ